MTSRDIDRERLRQRDRQTLKATETEKHTLDEYDIYCSLASIKLS